MTKKKQLDLKRYKRNYTTGLLIAYLIFELVGFGLAVLTDNYLGVFAWVIFGCFSIYWSYILGRSIKRLNDRLRVPPKKRK